MLQSSLFGNRDRNARPERKLSEFLGGGRNTTTQLQPQPQNTNLPSLQSSAPPNSVAQNSSNRLLKAKDADNSPREPEACFCSVQGKRPYQEDQYADANNPGVPETHFYGVFDGHAGGRCSKAIATAIPINLAKDEAFKSKLIQAIKRTISRTNDQFLEIAERMRLNDGSTGVFCVLREGKLIVANVGDSRAIMISNGKSVALTKDHKPSSPEEQRRIASFGGVITNNTGIPRVQGVLAVSRAYGNCSIRNYIRADPDIITRDLSPEDDFIVIASDGLWDVYRNSEVAEIVYAMDQQGCKLQRIADHLVQNSLLKGSMDNVTCVIIRINIYAARALSELLPPHLQQQIQLDANSSNANGVRTASRQSGTPKYDAKAWVGAEDDGELDSGLNGVSVYYPPGSIGGAGAASPYGSGSTASASRGGVGQEEEAAKKQSSSKQLSRSRSTNRLNKGSSKRATPDPYGTDVDVAGVDGDSGSFARRNSKQQNLNLNVTLSGGDTGESAYAASRAGKDSSQQGQMPFPISAYRSMHRPFTQASASTSGSGSVPSQQLEAVGRTPNVQKALFVPSAYASQVSAQGAAGEESPYSGGRSYTLLGGNSMVPVRDSGGGYARPNTSNAENNYLSAQRGYVSKRPDSYSNSRFVDSSARPNSAAPVLNHKVQTSASRYSGMSAQQQEQVREFPPPHSPISTGRNSRK